MKHVIIIGMGPGIGQALSEKFAHEGFARTLIARSPQPDDISLNAYDNYISCDVSNLNELREILQQAIINQGGVDVLIYNAVKSRPGEPTTFTAEELLDDLAVNVAAPQAAAQVATESMRVKNKGTILFTGGGWAIHPNKNFSATAIGKAAQRSLALCLAQEFEDTEIRIGTMLVMGQVAPNTAFCPIKIAERMYTMATTPQASWQSEEQFTGS